MATIQVRITRDDNTSITETRTISQANLDRVGAMVTNRLGKTMQQATAYALDRVIDQAKALTQNYERNEVPVADIPIT